MSSVSDNAAATSRLLSESGVILFRSSADVEVTPTFCYYITSNIQKDCYIRDSEGTAKSYKVSKVCYSDRLKSLNLSTLKYRLIGGDMMQVYKILSGKHDTVVAPVLTVSDTSVTRGNKYKL